jgi:hypothetical protein
MKWLLSTILLLCLSQAIFCQQPEAQKGAMIVPPDKFAEWGDIRLVDERVQLDKIANQLKEWRLSLVYLVIHAGPIACSGEAKARGIRAKNYLLKQGIGSERIVWIDAGWTKDLLVEVWIWPPEFGRPKLAPDESLKRSQVVIEPNCRIKYRGVQ